MAGRVSTHRRATVLGRTKLAEQDVILTMLTAEGEQLRAVAKGARKPGSRLSAHTALFCDTELLVSQGKRGLGIVSEAQTLVTHESLSADLDAYACACAVCEVARLTCYEDMPDPFLHPLLSRTLLACEQASDRPHLDIALAAYILKVCSHQGWRPVLAECVLCGDKNATRFSVSAGGALCESCARGIEGALPTSENLLAWLKALVGSTFDTLLEAPVDAGTAAQAADIAYSWASTHLDVRLRATEYFCGR